MARNPVVPARMAAEIEGEFVVFLIGMRINKLWKVHMWLPVAAAMGPMLAELVRYPELGLLGYPMTWAARAAARAVLAQPEQLVAFARDKDNPHLEAWRRFNRRSPATATSASGTRPTWCRPAATRRSTATCPGSGSPPRGCRCRVARQPASASREAPLAAG